MKYTLVVLAVLASPFLALSAASAQESTPDLDAARAELQAGRDEIIREDLQLSDDLLAAFWPVYEEYVAEISVVRDRKAGLVQQYMQAYRAGAFTDEFAKRLIDENFAIRGEWIAIQQSYVDRFKAVLPVQLVARFYQLENKMDAEVDAQLALAIPLVE